MQNQKAVICLTTFNRIDCARINQEIIALNYKNPIPIVHACSGLGYTKYLEDILVQPEPDDLQSGALNLIKKSVSAAVEKFNPEYIIHLEGDTWMMDEEVIYDLIKIMDKNKNLVLSTSAWDDDHVAIRKRRDNGIKQVVLELFAAIVRPLGYPFRIGRRDSLSTQFFIVRNTSKMINCIMDLKPIQGMELEQAFYKAFMTVFSKRNIRRLKEREPVHPDNRFVSERLKMFSQHWPARGTANDTRPPTHFLYVAPELDGKKESLQRFQNIRKGKYIQKMLSAKNYDYYNPGASRV
jgi:hypothetical protein